MREHQTLHVGTGGDRARGIGAGGGVPADAAEVLVFRELRARHVATLEVQVRIAGETYQRVVHDPIAAEAEDPALRFDAETEADPAREEVLSEGKAVPVLHLLAAHFPVAGVIYRTRPHLRHVRADEGPHRRFAFGPERDVE